MTLLEVHDVDKTFVSGGEAVPVLRGASLLVPAGQMHAVKAVAQRQRHVILDHHGHVAGMGDVAGDDNRTAQR